MTSLSPLHRIRWAVRGVLFLGVAASVTANILHARHNPISQTIAAWPPLAFLITVELISRVPVHRRSTAALRLVATAAIAGIAAWVSYWHMAATVSRYGETGAAPYLMPFSVDGLIVVASLSLVELAGRIRAAAVDHSMDTRAASVDVAPSDRAGDQTDRLPTPAGSGRLSDSPEPGKIRKSISIPQIPTDHVGDQTDQTSDQTATMVPSGRTLTDRQGVGSSDPLDDEMPPDPWLHSTPPLRSDQNGDHAADLRDQTGDEDDQTDIRPRPDADLVDEFGDQLRALRAAGKLTRYQVEQTTKAARRQAERILDQILAEGDQNTDQTDQTGDQIVLVASPSAVKEPIS